MYVLNWENITEETSAFSLKVSSLIFLCIYRSLKETTTNVNKLIASGTYPQDTATSLKLVLYFLKSIVGNNYVDGIFLSDGQKDDKEKAQMCSGHIYYGIQNIYKAFEGLAESETVIKCGWVHFRCSSQWIDSFVFFNESLVNIKWDFLT